MTATTLVQRQQQHDQRLAWLRSQPALCARLPPAPDAVDTVDQDAAITEVIKHMRFLQLVSMSMATSTARVLICRLVAELREDVTT